MEERVNLDGGVVEMERGRAKSVKKFVERAGKCGGQIRLD